MQTIKTRVIRPRTIFGSNGTRSTDGVYRNTPTPMRVASGYQWTSSDGHPYRKLGRSVKTDIGGPFETRKISWELETEAIERHWTSGYFGTYQDRFGVPCPSNEIKNLAGDASSLENSTTPSAFYDRLSAGVHAPTEVPGSSSLDAFGSGAIAAVAPVNPVVDLSVSLGEFISERKFFAIPGTAGSLPGEYLNYMFGIAPTIADVQDLRVAVTKREEILAQYSRDSGRLVRRRYEQDEDVNTVVTVTPNVALTYLGTASTSAHLGVLTTHTVTKRKLWFSGAFTYYLPQEGMMRTIAELDRLYGVKPGSALAWELVPFSWLVDYKLSIGSVMGNLDRFAADGLVMPYGYVMCRVEKTQHYSWSGSVWSGSSKIDRTYRGKITSVVKLRRPATPFGFGVKPEDLSLRQMSIIAALGLTKVM